MSNGAGFDGRVAIVTAALAASGSRSAGDWRGRRQGRARGPEARRRQRGRRVASVRVPPASRPMWAASADVEGLVARTLEREGRIDILINNAGIMGRTAPLWELSVDEWNHVLAVDLTSVFLVSRAIVPHMRARRSGAIVSVASIAGKEGTPNLIPYTVAKAGIIAFTKALGKEVVADGIRVNCVAPGSSTRRCSVSCPKRRHRSC
jgi:NAD(P)-dependent dehydrogenase (short-subunit alcohol dehydrogenase family)